MRRISAGLAALLLAGCTVLDPNRHANDLRVDLTPPAADAGDVARARFALHRQEMLYTDAAVEIDRLRTLGPLVAAGLGLAGAGLAVSSTGSADLQRGLIAGAAATLGFTAVYGDQARQALYRSGATAMRCLHADSEPFAYLPIEEARAVRQELTRAAEALFLARPGITSAGRWSNQDLDRLATSATAAQAELDTLLRLDSVIAERLRTRGRMVQAAIDREISSGLGDPLSVFRALTAGNAGLLSALPAPLGTAPGPAIGAAGQLRANEADAAADALRLAVERARVLIARLEPLSQTHPGRDCVPQTLANPLRISPPTREIMLGPPPAEARFEVSGGIGDRRVVPVGSSTGFTLAQSLAPGGALVVVVRAAPEATGRRLLLAFSDERETPQHFATIAVPGAVAAVTPTPTPTRPGGAAQAGTLLTPQQVRMVHRALGLEPATLPMGSEDAVCSFAPAPPETATFSPEAQDQLVRLHRARAEDVRAGRLAPDILTAMQNLAMVLAERQAAPTPCERARFAADNNLALLRCALMPDRPPSPEMRRSAEALVGEGFRKAVFLFQAQQARESKAPLRLEPTGTIDALTDGLLVLRAARLAQCQSAAPPG